MQVKKTSRAYGKFRHALILSDTPAHTQRDQLFLQAFGPDTVTAMTSGAEALEFMEAGNACDLILCDSGLDDMPGVKFVRLLQQHMGTKMVPVIMVTLENRKEHVLDAIAAGCCGYVLRPYSMKTFERYLALASQLGHYPEIEDLQLEEGRELVTMGDFDDAIEVFQEILDIQDDAQRYYDMGMHFLVQQKYGKAIVAFKKAVRLNDLFAEAYKGLADAYRAKGDTDKYGLYLQKAAEVHAQFDRLEEAKTLFIEALKNMAQMPNPFNTLGVNLRKQGDYRGALHAYRQALALTPEDENIYFNLAKAYYYMGELGPAGEQVAQALRLRADFPEAGKLYQRVYGRAWTETAGGPGPAPTEDTGPRSAKDV
ncbi:MAG: tetratricopeptide repeat protein [Desulfovibrionaceae bacterium]